MGKNKKKRNKPIPVPLSASVAIKPESRPSRWLRWGWGIVGGVALVITLLGLYPRVTITNSGPADDKNPLAATFTISNDGILPVFSVNYYCLVGQAYMAAQQLPKSLLRPGGKIVVPNTNCIFVPPNLLQTAHIGLRVSYRTIVWWRQEETRSIFNVTAIGSDHFRWNAESE
jgi:hypothetical protein